MLKLRVNLNYHDDWTPGCPRVLPVPRSRLPVSLSTASAIAPLARAALRLRVRLALRPLTASEAGTAT